MNIWHDFSFLAIIGTKIIISLHPWFAGLYLWLHPDLVWDIWSVFRTPSGSGRRSRDRRSRGWCPSTCRCPCDRWMERTIWNCKKCFMVFNNMSNLFRGPTYNTPSYFQLHLSMSMWKWTWKLYKSIQVKNKAVRFQSLSTAIHLSRENKKKLIINFEKLLNSAKSNETELWSFV